MMTFLLCLLIAVSLGQCYLLWMLTQAVATALAHPSPGHVSQILQSTAGRELLRARLADRLAAKAAQ